jgi:hypothetical protein
MAEDAIVSISASVAANTGDPSPVVRAEQLPLADEQQAGLAGRVLDGTATTLELGLALTNSNQRVRIKAAQALGKIGKDGTITLPQLQQALQTSDEVFKELLLLTHRAIAPDALQPLYRKEDLLPALRAVTDELAKTSETAMITEVNSASRSFFYDHAQLVSLADKIGTYDSRLRDTFVRKLTETEPSLAPLFIREP